MTTRFFRDDLKLKESEVSEHLPQIDLVSVLAEPNPHIDLRIRACKNLARNFLYKHEKQRHHYRLRPSHVAERKRLLELIQGVWKQEIVSNLHRKCDTKRSTFVTHAWAQCVPSDGDGLPSETSSLALHAMPLLVDALNLSGCAYEFIKSVHATYQEPTAIKE
ncbi:hypothetical protein BD779DRAFT_1469399 [Infundibulicybe gibba]|nr:hypothetical protein BD779DRAFT_1469399 [Infundibulicybe gibba]